MNYTTIMILFIPALLLTVIANIMVHTTFRKYNTHNSVRGMTGAEAAQAILHTHGIYNVPVYVVEGELTDHYNPANNSLNLSTAVYHGTSIAAIGVACHEAGHAMQYAHSYLPTKIRTLLVPIANFGARCSGLLIIGGCLFASFGLMKMMILAQIGVALFAASTLFQLVTLPTELNASQRAMQCIRECNILTADEMRGAKKVLTAAAMTYIASLMLSILELLRLIVIIRRDD